MMVLLGAAVGTGIASLPGIQSSDAHGRVLAFTLAVVMTEFTLRRSGKGYSAKALSITGFCMTWNAVWAFMLRSP